MEVAAEEWGRRVASQLATGDSLGVAVDLSQRTIGIAHANGDRAALVCESPAAAADCLNTIEMTSSPRWVWWDRSVANLLVRHGFTVTKSWDIPTAHRILCGGWRWSTPEIWAWLHDLDPAHQPRLGQLDLLAQGPIDVPSAAHSHVDGPDRTTPSTTEHPVQADGYLRPDWIAGGYGDTLDRLSSWAALTHVVQRRQAELLQARSSRSLSTARSESAAEFLCAQLEAGGLPLEIDALEHIISAAAGPRPGSLSDDVQSRARRDAPVLALVPKGVNVDLRNPNDVRAMLRHVSVDVPDTRAWRLEEHRDSHPIVEALLAWRKAERIATTYGWRWFDEHIHPSVPGWGRLRGDWSSCDGAAGRMTATAGLHNLPAEMRPAVVAEPGHVFVRADLGQIEPRILAAVSGDPAFITASSAADLYAPVARRLNVDRATAKVAVLGAMYGGTSGAQAGALRGLERSYPIAMKLLSDAAAQGEAGNDVFTIGGRRIRMWSSDDDAPTSDRERDGRIDRARSQAAARGRYARNAIIQGAAAEFFKVWAILVRAQIQPIGGEVVLCLHDELVLQVPAEHADETVNTVRDALAEAAHRWLPDSARGVRFVADVSTIPRWSDAKQ